MTWVRQAMPPAPHRCKLPELLGMAENWVGDLWVCDDCEAVWRVGRRCDFCDRYDFDGPHVSPHAVGVAWRLAKLSWWQRRRYVRLARKRPDSPSGGVA